MKRLLTAACRSCICFVLQMATIGSVAAQTAGGQALQKTAMLWSQTANMGAAIRRVIEPAEARALWDDPQIKVLRNEMENAWDFVSPDGVPSFGPLPPEDARDNLERIQGVRR